LKCKIFRAYFSTVPSNCYYLFVKRLIRANGRTRHYCMISSRIFLQTRYPPPNMLIIKTKKKNHVLRNWRIGRTRWPAPPYRRAWVSGSCIDETSWSTRRPCPSADPEKQSKRIFVPYTILSTVGFSFPLYAHKQH